MREFENNLMGDYEKLMQEIEDTFYSMHVYDYTNELIVILEKKSTFEVLPHFYEGNLFGYNVYTRQNGDLVLIDTFDNPQRGELLIKKLQECIKDGNELFFLPY